MPELISAKEAVSFLRCSPSTFRKYVSRKFLCPYEKSQGKNYFDKKEILNFIPPILRTSRFFSNRLTSDLDPSVVMTIIEKWGVNKNDKSSADVEIGIYTERIRLVEEKIKRLSVEDSNFRIMRFKLIRYVAERRKLLHYLKISDYRRYRRAMELIRKEAA